MSVKRTPPKGGPPKSDPPKLGSARVAVESTPGVPVLLPVASSIIATTTSSSLAAIIGDNRKRGHSGSSDTDASGEESRSLGRRKTKRTNGRIPGGGPPNQIPDAEPAEDEKTHGAYVSFITRDAVEKTQLAILEDLITGKMSKTMTTRVTERVLGLVRAVDDREKEIAFLRGRIEELERAESTPRLLSTQVGSRLPARSYAEAASQNPIRNGIRPSVYPEKLVITGNADTETSKDVMSRLGGIIRPAGEQLRVKHLLPRGKAEVLLVLGDNITKRRLLESEELRDAGLRVAEMRGRRPKMILRGVDRTLESEEIFQQVWKQNFADHGDFRDRFKLSFRTGRRDGERVNWVAEVDPELRKKIKAEGRIYIGWSSVRVEDFVVASRCFKCQRFGHLAARCSSKEDVCRHCGEEGHRENGCPRTTSPAICVTCRDQNLEHDHGQRDRDCPTYKKAIEQQIRNTDYGLKN